MRAAWRGLAVLVLAVCAGSLWLGGGGSLRVLRAAEAWSAGQTPPQAPYVCEFRQRTGVPCLGCGGTTAFGLAARGHLAQAAGTNPLGAFAGLAAWALAAAALLTLVSGAPLLLARTGLAVLVLFPTVFVVNAVVWWASLPPGALHP